MTALIESQHAGAFLLSEAPFSLSRSAVMVLSGQNLKAGAVVGRVALGIGRVSVPAVTPAEGSTANGTVSLVTAGPEVEVGTYTLECLTAVAHGGVWTLTTPSGKRLRNLTMTPGAGATTAYTSRHLNFSITDGSTDFAVGDKFLFVVSTTAPTVIGGTGTGTISGLSLGPDAKPGNYRVVLVTVVTHGGVFQVLGPDGDSIGQYTLTPGSGGTTAFTSRQINFSITDATDFIVGNHFNVAVFNQLAGGKAVAWDPTNFDGRHRAAGILLADVDASAGDRGGTLIDRNAEVRGPDLVYAATIAEAEKVSAALDLLRLGVKVRN